MPLHLKTESQSEEEESEENPVISIHVSEYANPPLVFKREWLKNRMSLAFGASKDNLDLLVGDTEVLKQDVVGRIESNSRFYFKICYL